MRTGRSRGQGGEQDDAGITVVLMALLLTGMLTVSAIVVDLGYVRGIARADQSIADLAALAGSEKLEEEKYVEACQDMVDYLNRNAKDMPAIDAGTFCAPMGGTVCTDGPAAQAAPTITSGKYTITIEFPVPNETGPYPAMGAGIEDGPPCDRMRVTVSSVEPSFLGGIVGASSYDVTRSATLRAGPGEKAKAPALWLLEPYGCNSLVTGGAGTSIVVGDLDRGIEGLISVDSNGTRTNGANGCSTGSPTVNVPQGRVHALPIAPIAERPEQDLGEIRLFAMGRWDVSCVYPACTPADVVGSPPRLAPMPTRAPRRATRAPVDHRYNCKTEYPDYDVLAPGFPGIEIPECPHADERSPYIDLLRTSARGSTRPEGFELFPRPDEPTDSCNVLGSIVLPADDWYVDCPTLSVSGGNSITFMGGNVVTRGGISSTGSGVVRFNCVPTAADPTVCVTDPPRDPSWVYMRSGDLDIKGPFTAVNTMVYMDDGFIKLTGGGSFTWTAPTEGPFAGLAAWAEKAGSYDITGGGRVIMAGAFFTPFANAMKISGNGEWNVRDAQYISRRLNVTGGAVLNMAPNPITALTLPPKEGFLIR